MLFGTAACAPVFRSAIVRAKRGRIIVDIGLRNRFNIWRLGKQPRSSHRAHDRRHRLQDHGGVSPTRDRRHVHPEHSLASAVRATALLTAVGPIFAMACVALLLRGGKPDEEPGQELTLGSPISLRRVLGYGMLFIAIEVLGTFGMADGY